MRKVKLGSFRLIVHGILFVMLGCLLVAILHYSSELFSVTKQKILKLKK